MAESIKAVVAWHNPAQIEAFLAAWKLNADDPRLHLQQDKTRAGCAATKNLGVNFASRSAQIVVVLDDDCYPDQLEFSDFLDAHRAALEPQPVAMFEPVTIPESRGTPYHNHHLTLPVAAAMGFWRGVGDYDACAQLVHGASKPMTFSTAPVYGRYFPLSGMNMSFRPLEWGPWRTFIDVPRFDDIWMGFLWQKTAYARGHCFNLNAPTIRHVRQSNVWQNLRDEAKHLEANETLWSAIATSPAFDYPTLRKLLPNP